MRIYKSQIEVLGRTFSKNIPCYVKWEVEEESPY